MTRVDVNFCADDEYEARYSPNVGPPVLPGTYTVTLAVDGKRYSKPVLVELDPRSDMTVTQLVAQRDAAVRMTELTAHVNRIIAITDNVLLQLTRLQEGLRRPASPDSGTAIGANDATPPTNPQVLTDVTSAITELKQFRDSVLARPLPRLGYRQYPRLREEVQTVTGMIARPMLPPTAGEMLRANELGVEVDQAQVRLDRILQERVGAINRALNGTPHVITPSAARVLIP